METSELRSSLVYEVRVFVDDPKDELRLGMPATVHLALRPASANAPPAAAQLPPKAAVNERRDRPGAGGRCEVADQAILAQRRGAHPRARLQYRWSALPGELTALVGPDGAGKTTLMRLAAGLLPPDAGSCAVLGVDVAADPQQVQDRISYMPQRFGLYEDLTVPRTSTCTRTCTA